MSNYDSVLVYIRVFIYIHICIYLNTWEWTLLSNAAPPDKFTLPWPEILATEHVILRICIHMYNIHMYKHSIYILNSLTLQIDTQPYLLFPLLFYICIMYIFFSCFYIGRFSILLQTLYIYLTLFRWLTFCIIEEVIYQFISSL